MWPGVGGGGKTLVIPPNPWDDQATAIEKYVTVFRTLGSVVFGCHWEPEAAERLFPSLATISPPFTSAAPSGMF